MRPIKLTGGNSSASLMSFVMHSVLVPGVLRDHDGATVVASVMPITVRGGASLQRQEHEDQYQNGSHISPLFSIEVETALQLPSEDVANALPIPARTGLRLARNGVSNAGVLWAILRVRGARDGS